MNKNYLKIGLITATIISIIVGLFLLSIGTLSKEVYSLELKISFFEPSSDNPWFGFYFWIEGQDMVFNISVSGSIGSKNEMIDLWSNQMEQIIEEVGNRYDELDAVGWAINWDGVKAVSSDDVDNYANFFPIYTSPSEILTGLQPIIDFTSQIVELVFGIIFIIISAITGFLSIKLK